MRACYGLYSFSQVADIVLLFHADVQNLLRRSVQAHEQERSGDRVGHVRKRSCLGAVPEYGDVISFQRLEYESGDDPPVEALGSESGSVAVEESCNPNINPVLIMVCLAQGFAEPLPLFITRPRSQRIDFSLIRFRGWENLRIAVSLARRSIEDSRIILPRQVQHSIRSRSIRQSRLHRVFLVIFGSRSAREMKDHVNLWILGIRADISLFELETLHSLQVINVLEDPCREIIQANYSRI